MNSPIEAMSRQAGIPIEAVSDKNKPIIKIHGKLENEIGAKAELPLPLRQQQDLIHRARMHGGAFPSSEEESMAEVEDDYDDESCSSNDDVPHQRLDRSLDQKPSGEAIELMTRSQLHPHILPVPPAATIAMSPRSEVAAMIRPEEETSEGSVVMGSALRQAVLGAAKGNCSLPPTVTTVTSDPSDTEFHEPKALPQFEDAKMCMWTSSHAANCPSEDRSCSLVNILLRPLPDEQSGARSNNRTLVRVSLWSVIDGHGGGCVATYASEVLLPHVAASMARALKCEIVDRGVCTVNGELRDANALDLDGLIRTSDRTRANPNSIDYETPCEKAASEEEGIQEDPLAISEEDTVAHDPEPDHSSPPSVQAEVSIALPLLPENDPAPSLSSVKTSVKTAASLPHTDVPVGTHGPGEVANITRAITESFLAVDEGWINSIDPVATHQSSCQSNGRWNAGACALVVFTVQRLEWTSTSVKNRKSEMGGQYPRDDTPQNKDAARRRRLDYVSKAKSASSMSTISSTSSILTDNDPNNESEITETEDDGEESDMAQPTRKSKARQSTATPSIPVQTVITSPGGCECHAYRPHEAMLYTAHVGDCRAVLLGSAPPRTIKVGPVADSSTDHPDTTDDESSYHSSDETECLSSSDHDAESSDEEDPGFEYRQVSTKTPPYLKYMRRPARRQSRRRRDMGNHAPFVALPPLPIAPHSSSEGSESETETLAPPEKTVRVSAGHDSDENSNESSLLAPHGRDMSPPLELPPSTRPLDLTTDHSAYNPAEVSAVMRRCNNAPRAISAGVGGGIKRVAGSLAVTRALGDAYLKTPQLSFNPYKSHAPYITAQPEVNCRLLTKDGDRVLILATDGVWERCNGEDVMRWVRNYSAERIAEAERRNNRRRGSQTERMAPNDDGANHEVFSGGEEEKDAIVGQKRDRLSPAPGVAKKRKVIPSRVVLRGTGSAPGGPGAVSTVADVIVRRVLNKVRRARNMSSLHALMSLPKGRARRSKHDDITASVVDLSAFVA